MPEELNPTQHHVSEAIPDYAEWCNTLETSSMDSIKDNLRDIGLIDLKQAVNYQMLFVLSIYSVIIPNPDSGIFRQVEDDIMAALPKKLNQKITWEKEHSPESWYERGYADINEWYQSFNPNPEDVNAIQQIAIMYDWVLPKIWMPDAEKIIRDKELPMKLLQTGLYTFRASVKRHLFYHHVSPQAALQKIYPTNINTGLKNRVFKSKYGSWEHQVDGKCGCGCNSVGCDCNE